MNGHIFVCGDEQGEVMEFPLESNSTLLLSTLTNVYPTATGLKYKNPDGDSFRVLRLAEGRLYPPPETGGSWANMKFYCVHGKDMKRKGDECEPTVKVDQDIPQFNYGVQNKRVDLKQTSDLIVLGLAWTTDEDGMKRYFQQFGEVQMVQIKRNPVTRESKGFGFIRFSDYSAQVAVLSDKHKIDGRWCTVRVPNSKMEPGRQENDCKIHVRGITEAITSDDLRNFFSEFGVVEDVYIPRPFRSFAFVTFADPRSASTLIGRELTIRSVHVNIGTAAPKNSHLNIGANSMNSQSMNKPSAMGDQMSSTDPNVMASLYSSLFASSNCNDYYSQAHQNSDRPDHISALSAMAAQYAAAQQNNSASWGDQRMPVDQRQSAYPDEYRHAAEVPYGTNQNLYYSAPSQMPQNPYAMYNQQNYARNDASGGYNSQGLDATNYSVASQGVPANIYSQTYGASMHSQNQQPMPPGVGTTSYQSSLSQPAYDSSRDGSFYQSSGLGKKPESQTSMGQMPAYRRY